jgi:SPP1 gp7 family putative phage head morphogenesis protein
MANTLNPMYQKMIEQIKLDAEKYADEQMKSVYSNQKANLEELHQYLGMLYIKNAENGLLNVTPQQKKVLLADIDKKLKDMGKNLGQQEVDQVINILADTYPMVYYHNAYILDSGMKNVLNFGILKKEYIDAAVNNPIDGKIFSDRIWTNKANLVDSIKQGIEDSMNGKIHLDELARSIKQQFNVTAYESKRLVMNESARVQSQASNDLGENIGVTKQMYTATLDGKTSDKCAALDGHVYDIDDPDKVVPPENHTSCRCCLINMPSEDWKPSKRLDNESRELIDYQDYDSWAKEKGID